jgi:hypothetical protein
VRNFQGHRETSEYILLSSYMSVGLIDLLIFLLEWHHVTTGRSRQLDLAEPHAAALVFFFTQTTYFIKTTFLLKGP